MDPEIALEIETAVRDQLSHFGASGRVVFLGRQIELHGSGPPVSIDVDPIAEQWPLLPPDLRLRKASDLARRLVQGQRADGPFADAARPPTDGARPPSMRPSAEQGAAPAAPWPGVPRRPAPSPGAPAGGQRFVVIPLGGVLLAAIAGYFAYRVLREPEAPAPAPAASVAEPPDDPARVQRVCEAARKRVYSGASISALDTEGWVAELWVAGKKPAAEGALAPLIADGRISAAADAELGALTGARVEVVPGFPAGEEARFPGWSATTLRMSGRYMTAFLDPGLRPRLLAVAERVADATGAELGALYGRCAHLPYRELGTWFRGADASAAATALVYALGLFVEQPAVNRKALDGLGGATPLDALRAAGATGKLDAEGLATLTGAEGGSLTAGKGGAVTLTFPLGGPTRATRASRIVARKLGVGVE